MKLVDKIVSFGKWVLSSVKKGDVKGAEQKISDEVKETIAEAEKVIGKVEEEVKKTVTKK